MEIKIDDFELDGHIIRFRHPIVFLVQDTSYASLVWLECPELDVSFYSDDGEDEYRELIQEGLENLWLWLVDAADDELTPDALDVKHAFLDAVKPEDVGVDFYRLVGNTPFVGAEKTCMPSI